MLAGPPFILNEEYYYSLCLIFYPSGKPLRPHLLRYQAFDVGRLRLQA